MATEAMPAMSWTRPRTFCRIGNAPIPASVCPSSSAISEVDDPVVLHPLPIAPPHRPAPTGEGSKA